MSKKTIQLTDKQYEVLRALILSLTSQLETRESYTKRLHCSRKKECFYTSANWRCVKILTHLKKEFK